MSTVSYKVLCAELVDAWENGKDYWAVIYKIQDALRGSSAYESDPTDYHS